MYTVWDGAAVKDEYRCIFHAFAFFLSPSISEQKYFAHHMPLQYFLYTHLKMCVCVCARARMFAYSSRTDTPICSKLDILIPWDQKEILGRSKVRKIVLNSSPGEGDYSSSETKQGRRTEQRTELFVSARRLQEIRSQTRKTLLRSSLGKDVVYRDKFFYDIQRHISNNQLWGNKRCKHVSNFAAVKLRARC
jgi:hypothetical protein